MTVESLREGKEPCQLKRELSQSVIPGFWPLQYPGAIRSEIVTSQVLIGDAIDDVADIFNDLSEVAWAFEHTSADDAMWRFEFGFRNYWVLT